MTSRLTCPHGHQWEWPHDGTEQAQDTGAECPVCGAAAISGAVSAMTILGLVTLLIGVCYAALGCWIVYAGVTAMRSDNARVYGIVAAFGMIAVGFGAAFLLLSGLALLAGFGVLLRKQWGCILTFILAPCALLLGLLAALQALGDADGLIGAAGAVQLVYGILAFVILIRNSADFSRAKAEARKTKRSGVDSR